MKIKACDRCKAYESPQTMLRVLKLIWEEINPKTLDYWVGREKSIELCERCFEDFMNYKILN